VQAFRPAVSGGPEGPHQSDFFTAGPSPADDESRQQFAAKYGDRLPAEAYTNAIHRHLQHSTALRDLTLVDAERGAK
jgi:hypothetical protein